MATTYVVKPGESIWDVVINATGSIDNLDQVLEDNNLDSWTAEVAPGQLITISDAVEIDTNIQRDLQTYPVCNLSVMDIDGQIEAIFERLNDDWILSTGFWNVHAVWKANGVWKTGP